eukprot:TRINITY_DN712_c0_g1_i1.p1 TRINITY_DN712_c0_g1~~TRINITY_DN712_c0_g1_i1.p1  ORF type:complete len:486 (+),score=129.97 TRINITY_DN712_c0_g1_i1:59-1459(+)
MSSSGMLGCVVMGARKIPKRPDGETIVCVVSMDKQQVKTKTIPAVEDPDWEEEFKFDVTRTSPELHVALWSGNGKEFLGQAVIPTSAIRTQTGERELWLKLEKRKWRLSDKVAGDIHLKLRYQATDEKKISMDDFETLKVLGKGGFGKVMLVKKKDTDRLYAMKVIRKEHVVRRQEIDHTLAEKHVLSKISHPYIIALKYAFQTEDKLYLVLDYINGGELFYHLQRERKFAVNRAKFYAAEIVLCLSYLHELGIIYRDLKPENLLLDGMGHVCMTDFGLCKEGLGIGETTNTFCGSLEYLAPEVLDTAAGGYTTSVDWWSLGILLYEMMAGLPPFYHQDQNLMAKKILSQELVFPDFFPEDAKDLLRKFIDRDPARRLQKAEDIKKHPFFAVIDWDALYNRKIDAPFKPLVSGEADVSNFDPEFTSEAAVDSYVESSLSKSIQDNFQGFTYVAPSEMAAEAAPPSS